MSAKVLSLRAREKKPAGRRAGADMDLKSAQPHFACTGAASLLHAGCTCRGAGKCPTCQAWTARYRLGELVAAAARGA